MEKSAPAQSYSKQKTTSGLVMTNSRPSLVSEKISEAWLPRSPRSRWHGKVPCACEHGLLGGVQPMAWAWAFLNARMQDKLRGTRPVTAGRGGEMTAELGNRPGWCARVVNQPLPISLGIHGNKI